MIFRHPNGNDTYPKTDSLECSLAFSHNSYSYPLTLLVLYGGTEAVSIHACWIGKHEVDLDFGA